MAVYDADSGVSLRSATVVSQADGHPYCPHSQPVRQPTVDIHGREFDMIDEGYESGDYSQSPALVDVHGYTEVSGRKSGLSHEVTLPLSSTGQAQVQKGDYLATESIPSIVLPTYNCSHCSDGTSDNPILINDCTPCPQSSPTKICKIINNLARECINTRCKLEDLDGSTHSNLAMLRNICEDLLGAYRELNRQHDKLATRHDDLAGIANHLADELVMHAKALEDLRAWKYNVQKICMPIDARYHSAESVHNNTPGSPPTVNIVLSGMSSPAQEPTNTTLKETSIVSPMSPLEESLEPRLYLKIRGWNSPRVGNDRTRRKLGPQNEAPLAMTDADLSEDGSDKSPGKTHRGAKRGPQGSMRDEKRNEKRMKAV